MFNLNQVFKKPRYIVLQQNTSPQELPRESTPQTPAIPDGLWSKCPACGETLYAKDLQQNLEVCAHCGHHHRIDARTRLEWIFDTGTFKEIDADLISGNPLDFPDYEQKLHRYQKNTDLPDAVLTAYGKIHGNNGVVAVMDSHFMMGSMGSVVGEKITRAVEFATSRGLPVILFTASGGARMQEGMYSLMQMAKTSAAIARHHKAGGLTVTVLTDPTTGGVTASFAMLGDIILAEPGALIGFAGKRVAEQTIGQTFPEGFQTAEFLLEHGFIDKIVPRDQLKKTLSRLIKYHQK